MHRISRATTAVALSVALTATAVGCSQDEKKAAPRLPAEFCWDAFSPEDVQPLLPVGDTLKEDTDPFRFSETKRFVSCLLYVDGNDGLHAWAKVEDDETFTERNTYESADPDPIPVGRKGIVWNTGATTHISCHPAENTEPLPGKYLRLSVELSGAAGQNERKTLPGLLKQFTTFAQKELKCE
ncbi:hypothetical protein ACIQMO_23095 [Streptomyces sp. NPDC091406]|uniref:hypothetical protein n=1 Tax=unclassified Streptomyces TaxID=2593676 RepID=UPI0038116FAD